jgi:hypothetical protein
MLDKISLSLETMISLGDIRIKREIVRMFGKISATITTQFRDDCMLMLYR